MHYAIRLLTIVCVSLTSGSLRAADFPSWAYPVNPPNAPAARIDDAPRHVPNSAATFTQREIIAIVVQPPDWHPEEHSEMKGIVGHSREPRVYACAYCHLPNGAGRPENSNLAGLSANYIKAQVIAFRDGQRPGSEPKRSPHAFMSALAHQLTDAEIETSAAYFASLPPVSFTTVIETSVVPRTTVSGWMLKTVAGVEPIGNRIIEVAEEFERFENRDSRTPYFAYVPLGSIAQGAKLATRKTKGVQSCTECHGPDLHGVGDVPRIASRSPSYLFRQMYDIRENRRSGASSELMKPVVKDLSDADLIAIAAYAATRK